jgi:hypothetical protein
MDNQITSQQLYSSSLIYKKKEATSLWHVKPFERENDSACTPTQVAGWPLAKHTRYQSRIAIH